MSAPPNRELLDANDDLLFAANKLRVIDLALNRGESEWSDEDYSGMRTIVGEVEHVIRQAAKVIERVVRPDDDHDDHAQAAKHVHAVKP